MNYKQFRNQFSWVIALYVIATFTGAFLAYSRSPWYSTFKDLIPLVIAGPAAWLGYCFQRRQAFLKDAREIWCDMLEAVQEAIQYTHRSEPTQEHYGETLKGLSYVIDDVRALYSNLGESRRNRGLYPFEGLKDIRRAISVLGFGPSFRRSEAPAARREIEATWRKVQRAYLGEYSRGEPVRPDTPFLLPSSSQQASRNSSRTR